MISMLSVECEGPAEYQAQTKNIQASEKNLNKITDIEMVIEGKQQKVPLYQRDDFCLNHSIEGPAIIVEKLSTHVVEAGWQASINQQCDLILQRIAGQNKKQIAIDKADPILLEVFNNLFMSIAEQMGDVLARTAVSTNIKERLDYSCAIFDPKGKLVANAPHIPIHLGSMGLSVEEIIRRNKGKMQKGDVYLINDPFNGGTHLPDITAIMPFFADQKEPLFYVAARGHHADVGGITPGSMPANSVHIDEEGVLITDFQLVKENKFKREEFIELMTRSAKYPTRNIKHNLADIKAQVACLTKGCQELQNAVNYYSSEVVVAYMRFVQKNAEDCARAVLSNLKSGECQMTMDCGATIAVKVSVNNKMQTATIDFSGSSDIQKNNFNAPAAITFGAVLYVFRALVQDPIPMNAGCLIPLEVILPKQSMLTPKAPAAVVAGNVETSQWIIECLLRAMQVIAESQGTTNNITFGNQRYQYYETVAGGYGAGNGFNGASGVQVHITNTLLTDPEVLELDYPVLVEDFHLRQNSGGKGQWNGGDGLVRKIKFLEAMTVNVLSTHRERGPFGLAGGGDAKAGTNQVIRADDSIETFAGSCEFHVEPGDVLVMKTPGGGAYGA